MVLDRMIHQVYGNMLNKWVRQNSHRFMFTIFTINLIKSERVRKCCIDDFIMYEYVGFVNDKHLETFMETV